MDNGTLKKYFNLGDHVDVMMRRDGISGIIVDFSDTTIVIEDFSGSPIVISLDTVLSCKKHDYNHTFVDLSNSTDRTSINTSSESYIANEAVKSLEKIYQICNIQPENTIITNARVVNLSLEGVEVLTDEGQSIICLKSSYVGYNRENATIGNRVFCAPGKNGMSYSTISEMTYSELFERFVRAINTKPVPRSTIVGSILFYLTNEYGSSIHGEKKNIKQLMKKLNGSNSLDTQNSFSTTPTLKISDLTEEQKNDIYELLNNHRLEFADLAKNDQIKYANSLLLDNLKIRINKIAIGSILLDVFRSSVSEKSIVDNVFQSEDPFISATCEIVQYYPSYNNGTLKDATTDGIRFKEEIVIDEDLRNRLNTCWNTPIPVICAYKISGRRNIATFITEPGKLSELRSKVISLRSSGKSELADLLSEYIDKNGHLSEPDLQIDLDLSSSELLTVTRRQRLIKNFEQAEKGFLELISREYEFDAVVRDLAAMYQEWNGPKKAIEVLEMYFSRLEEKVKTYNQLSLLYQAIGDKTRAIDVMKKSLNLIQPTSKENVKKIEKLKKRINLLEKNKNTKAINILSDVEIPSEFIRYDANNSTSNVLAYVKDKTIEEKLEFVRMRIGELKNSPELPFYYLAKVNLVESMGESSSSKLIKDSLADYCRAKARNYFNEGNFISAREYLLEGVSLCDREDLYYLLLLSLTTHNIQEILSKYNSSFKSYEDISVDEMILIEDYDVYYVLLRMVSQDSIISKRILKTIFHSDSCEWICEELEIGRVSLDVFVNKISAEAKRYHNDFISFEDKLESFISIRNAVELCKSLLEIQIPELSCIDKSNISTVMEIANLVVDFNKNLEYEECDEISRNAFRKIDSGINAIQQQPTHLSTLRILPILLKLRDILERMLNKKYLETIPNIIVNTIDDARSIEDDVEIQISVTNETGFQRANNCMISINSINGKDVRNLMLKSTFDTPLSGGGILTTSFTIKSSFLDGDEINISYSFTYFDVRKKERGIQGELLYVINRGNDYEDFDNPYIAHVKSNAVKDKSMFKGRDDIINTICTYVLEDYKGYVLYGQKRSGKSSVLYHITQRLREEHKAFAVEYTMGNNIVQDAESENDTMANLFYTIISEIGRAIKEVDRKTYKEAGCHIIRRQEFERYPEQTFREYLDFYMDIIHDKLHYEQEKIVLIVDEFTYLYYHILEGKISSGIMEFWKGLLESRVFSFVFAGQDAMPRFMDEFQNVFASMHPQELTYIDEVSARELIELPIWNNKKNTSRYTEDAVNEIIKLTACSPFYIMILCSELVKYARQRKRLPIHVSDVDALVRKMICNESSISRKDFDNLISCGESRLDIIDKDESLMILKEIAFKARHIDYYDIDKIMSFKKEKVRNIIEDLLRRGVLERHSEFGNKVKIKVELFKRWLLNHE